MYCADVIEKTGVVDLFCGIGGMSHGFLQAGFKLSAGIDFDITCKKSYEVNNNADFIHSDLSKPDFNLINDLYQNNKFKILIGCAPCQPFSSYSYKSNDKDKWSLLRSFGSIIQKVKPDVISMENVPGLLKFKKDSVYEDFLEVLEREGFSVSENVVYCPDYGIPQKRTRLVLLASKLGEIKLKQPTHSKKNYLTLHDAIGHMPPLKAGEKHTDDDLHVARSLTQINLKRIRLTPQGGGWKDWPEELRLDCHKKPSGNSYGSIYGRMSWDEPAPTMTTHCVGYGNGRFGHPEQDRAISLREAALIQTFPQTYNFLYEGRFSSKQVATHIGNAVPVELGKVIAESIMSHIARYQNEQY